MNAKSSNKYTRSVSAKFLHIVSFDVPYPPDYGGAMDVYYRVRALHQLGIKVILHCFEYGRGRPQELEQICHEVHYYPRKRSINYLFSQKPFIIVSRQSIKLLQRLKDDDHPILFEGLHTCAFLGHTDLKKRLKLVRTHNIEHEYYQALAKQSKGWRAWFFSQEAKKLKKFEDVLLHANLILAIKESEQGYFSKYAKTCILPPSLPDISPTAQLPKGDYALFHGNLSVPENKAALHFLLHEVVLPKGLNDRLIVAGKNPDAELLSDFKQAKIRVIPNPGSDEMSTLIRDARVHVFYSHQDSGVKLKLLSAMQSGGWVLANSNMLSGSDMHAFCFCPDSAEAYQNELKERLASAPEMEVIKARIDFLREHYNTLENCKLIAELL